MSVVIKGMEMPDSCRHCCMMTGTFCDILNIDVDPYYDGSKHRNVCCPLVELPEKHGRLVEFVDVATTTDEDTGTETVNLGEAFAAYFKMRESNPVIEAKGEE